MFGGHAMEPKGCSPATLPLKCVLFILGCLVWATAERRSWLGGNPGCPLPSSAYQSRMLSSAESGAPHPVSRATWEAASQAPAPA